ncbi:MAG: tRNA pseudouridine(38-40) synthase TruA [Gemmataceae bacterium]
MASRNFKFVLAYDGTDFFGWQIQPKKRTVQETLETVIALMTQEKRVKVNASGRTDSGVHAVGQVVNFHTDTHHSAEVLMRGVNARLPADVVISSAEVVPRSFDANRTAVKKLYRYVIHDADVPNPFLRRYCHQSRQRLDVDLMREAADCLKGKHDFACFETEWPNRASSVRTILHLSLSRVGEWIWVDVEADGFLYNMVRAITGTLVQVGRGYWPPSQVKTILESRDRTQAGPNVPPQGLFLMRVTYPETLE